MSQEEIRSEGPILTPEETYYMQRRKEELKRLRKKKRNGIV
jgi:hypothetical protein